MMDIVNQDWLEQYAAVSKKEEVYEEKELFTPVHAFWISFFVSLYLMCVLKAIFFYG